MPWVATNLVGRRFGRLRVRRLVQIFRRPLRGRRKQAWVRMWLCRCDCGNWCEVDGQHLRSDTTSCGCAQRSQSSEANRTHGHSRGGRSLTYRSWLAMRDRCDPKNADKWPRYAGMYLAPKWQRFEAFLADMGECPEGHTLDRIQATRGYRPGNCRWATRSEQATNRCTTRFLTYRGRTQSMTAWATERGIPRGTIKARLDRYGWSVARALGQRPLPRRVRR